MRDESEREREIHPSRLRQNVCEQIPCRIHEIHMLCAWVRQPRGWSLFPFSQSNPISERGLFSLLCTKILSGAHPSIPLFVIHELWWNVFVVQTAVQDAPLKRRRVMAPQVRIWALPCTCIAHAHPLVSFSCTSPSIYKNARLLSCNS